MNQAVKNLYLASVYAALAAYRSPTLALIKPLQQKIYVYMISLKQHKLSGL